MARWQEEIPADQAAAEAAGASLEAAEAHLEELQEGIKDEVEGHHQALNKVGAVDPYPPPVCVVGCVVGCVRGGLGASRTRWRATTRHSTR